MTIYKMGQAFDPVGFEDTARDYAIRVLQLRVNGYDHTRIENSLGIAPSTQYRYVTQLRTEEHCETIAQLIAKSVALGWIKLKA